MEQTTLPPDRKNARRPQKASPAPKAAPPQEPPKEAVATAPQPPRPAPAPAPSRAPKSNHNAFDVNTFPAITESADRIVHAIEGRLSHGVSPASITLAYLDWLVHLTNSPGKMMELSQNAMTKGMRFAFHAAKTAVQQDAEAFIKPLPQDGRFSSEHWQKYPFNLYHQAFLLSEQWWHYATTGVRGMSRHHQEVVSFMARQMLDMFSPSNFPPTNPDVIQTTMEQGGANLQRGLQKFIKDFEDILAAKPPSPGSDYQVGVNIACTPGKVVYRNRMIELIQYSPETEKVHPEPILIVPAWIMKYYILDLSPNNSMVKYLLSQGYTVFMISWRNPGPDERDIGMEDYLNLGVRSSLGVIQDICGKTQVHGAGYCLGGTLLSIAAATLARENNDTLKSITLFAAQTDFEEAGEIMLFIDDSQVSFLEDMMWDQGYLDTKQMSGAFQMLRSNDLIWSKLLREYILGEDDQLNDLMTWNSDATRMPARMHSEYLRDLFLHNDLSRGRFCVGGRPIALIDIQAPICAVGTTKDHIAPWKSVFKIRMVTDCETTFILTNGGHNTGIVNPPSRTRSTYQMHTPAPHERYMDPSTWEVVTTKQSGSWWPAWVSWLNGKSLPADATPPKMGSKNYPPLVAAPGDYVLVP